METFKIMLALVLLYSAPAAALEINMDAIRYIESKGNPLAHNKVDDSRGLYQITPIVLKEWNAFHPAERMAPTDLWRPAVNFKIGNWYMNDRCPAMIKHFGKPDTIENRIICYNAGISYVKTGKPLPKITKKYITKYAALTNNEEK